jgi:hypothetical protein
MRLVHRVYNTIGLKYAISCVERGISERWLVPTRHRSHKGSEVTRLDDLLDREVKNRLRGRKGAVPGFSASMQLEDKGQIHLIFGRPEAE